MCPRSFSLSLCAIVLTLSTAGATKPNASSTPVAAPTAAVAKPAGKPAIRDFDVATLSRLGRELYRNDQLTREGTDAVSAQIGQAQLKAENCCGWVVDTSGPQPLLRFVRATGEGEEAAYDVSFPADGKRVVSVPQDRQLTERQKLIRRAYATASDCLGEGQLTLCRCTGNYSFAVLDDPAGPGFLVYLLRPKDAADSIPVGGHYRLSVSADAGTVSQVDRLWASCLTMNKAAGVPTDGASVMLAMNHLISPTPLETHVFLSLQDSMPFRVATMDGRAWWVQDGEIRDREKAVAPAGKAKAGVKVASRR